MDEKEEDSELHNAEDERREEGPPGFLYLVQILGR
jgi:hypothetical protein